MGLGKVLKIAFRSSVSHKKENLNLLNHTMNYGYFCSENLYFRYQKTRQFARLAKIS